MSAGLMACGTDPPERRGTPQPDAGPTVDVNNGLEPDADPGQPDAVQGVEDADPGEPDADPGEPDADPGEPDANNGEPDAELDAVSDAEADATPDAEADATPDADLGNQPAAVQDVVISEFMAQSQAGGGDTGEFIEFYNPTQTSFNLNGCVLDKTNTMETKTISTDVLIGPGEYAVFASSADGLGAVTPDGVFSFQLTNNGGGIALICDDTTIDELTYGGAHVTRGVSYQKNVNNFTGSNEPLADHWCLTPDDGTHEYVTDKHGTPGSANVACP
ncbi:MAG: lamin tail domain-containing protein [Bradymonadaceae bacterium]